MAWNRTVSGRAGRRAWPWVGAVSLLLIACSPSEPPPAGEEAAPPPAEDARDEAAPTAPVDDERPGAAAAAHDVAAVPARRSLVIEGVNVVATDEPRVDTGRTVVVRDGRITGVGAAGEVDVPDDALRIEGSGRYLVPGLAEMHGHLPGAGADPEHTANILFLYVANGITLVRGMQGHESQLRVREAVGAGEMLGPRLVLGSPAQGWGNTPEADEAAARVREYREAGYDLVKIGEGPDPETFDIIIETAREAGLPVGGHVPDEVGIERAMEAGIATIDHLDNYLEALVPDEYRADIAPLWGVASVAEHFDTTRIPALAELTVERDVAQVPTMVLWEIFFGDRSGETLRAEMEETRYWPAEMVGNWVEGVAARHDAIGHPEGAARVVDTRRDVFRALHEAGATFLLGTDSPQLFSVPGFMQHREMALWVELGMSPWEVIHAGTRAVAEHFGEADESGAVCEGCRADLVLLEANPLDDIGHFTRRAGVVVDGRWLPESEIQARLEAIAGAAQAAR